LKLVMPANVSQARKDIARAFRFYPDR